MANRPDSYFTLFTGDYLRDTMHLTTRQHGAYQLLLMHYYGRGGPIPLDEEVVRTITRETPDEWNTDRDAVMAYFTRERDGWHQKRADKELRDANIRYNRAVAGGRGKANKQRLSSDQAAVKHINKHLLNACSNGANPNPNPNPLNQTTNVSEVDMSVGSRSKSANRGERWPADAIVPEDWIEAGTEARTRNQLPAIDLRLEAQRFVNFWASKTGASATKRDWRKTWINWAISPYAGGKPNGTGQHGTTHPLGVFGQLADDARAAAARASGPTDHD